MCCVVNLLYGVPWLKVYRFGLGKSACPTTVPFQPCMNYPYLYVFLYTFAYIGIGSNTHFCHFYLPFYTHAMLFFFFGLFWALSRTDIPSF